MVTWTIAQLERSTKDGNVITAHWVANLMDGDCFAHRYGSQYFEYDSTDPDFIAYEDLTEDIVLGWLFDAIGEEEKDAIEDSMNLEIEEKKKPKVETGLPW